MLEDTQSLGSFIYLIPQVALYMYIFFMCNSEIKRKANAISHIQHASFDPAVTNLERNRCLKHCLIELFPSTGMQQFQLMLPFLEQQSPSKDQWAQNIIKVQTTRLIRYKSEGWTLQDKTADMWSRLYEFFTIFISVIVFVYTETKGRILFLCTLYATV